MLSRRLRLPSGCSVFARVPYSPTRHLSKAPKEHGQPPLLRTFDPARLRAVDHLDLTNLLRFTFVKAKRPETNGEYFPYYKGGATESPFPPRTAGFFYYHRPEDLPPTAGGVRFRIAAVNPETFPRGQDLLLPTGRPWQIPFSSIAASTTRPVLRAMLLREGLIREAEIATHGLERRPRERGHTLLHSFGEPFSMSFQAAHYIRFVTRGESHRVDVRVFHEQRTAFMYPYSGRALVRFEVSTLPQHAGRRFALLRLVKMIEPPKLAVPDYDGYLPRPVEGEFVMRPSRTGRRLQPWARDLDRGLGAKLALLLDAGAGAGAEVPGEETEEEVPGDEEEVTYEDGDGYSDSEASKKRSS